MKIDLATYLKKKQIQKEEVEKNFQREDFCYSCFRLKKTCLCQHIIPFENEIEIVILIHPMEAKKEKMGTGRMTKAFLKSSRLISGIDFSMNEEVNELIRTRDCYVLYPGNNAINISNDDDRKLSRLSNKMVIFVIDGTWPCAKKMMKLSSNLHHLPRISFEVKEESLFAIKEQPSKFCLSTIESIHLLLSECDRRKIIKLNGAHEQMLVAFKSMVEFQMKCAEDPNLLSYRRSEKGYSRPSDRKKSTKWQKRSIIFKLPE